MLVNTDEAHMLRTIVQRVDDIQLLDAWEEGGSAAAAGAELGTSARRTGKTTLDRAPHWRWRL